jgi:hypothetical protein
MLIAMVVGVLVLSSAMSLAVSTFRSMAGLTLRDGIDRNARFLGMVLQRDLTETGVDLEAQADFGTLAVWADSISILRVPYTGNTPAPIYRLATTLTGGTITSGLCGGGTCIEIQSAGVPTIVAGDLVRVQYQTVRRLALVQSVTSVTGGYRLTLNATQTHLIHHDAGVLNSWISLSPAQAANILVQEVAAVWYFRSGTQLVRAANLNLDGTPNAQVVAEGVQTFDASLIFTDGDELTQAVGTTDADPTNNYNLISGIRVRATMQAERTDARVNGGVLLTRDYEWFVAPRNLIYERNRMGV